MQPMKQLAGSWSQRQQRPRPATGHMVPSQSHTGSSGIGQSVPSGAGGSLPEPDVKIPASSSSSCKPAMQPLPADMGATLPRDTISSSSQPQPASQASAHSAPHPQAERDPITSTGVPAARSPAPLSQPPTLPSPLGRSGPAHPTAISAKPGLAANDSEDDELDALLGLGGSATPAKPSMAKPLQSSKKAAARKPADSSLESFLDSL